MAIGTVASRGTGFLRTAAVAYALGSGALANAYNVANVLPNIVYELLLGGVLTSVVVPLLVAATKRDEESGAAGIPGELYGQRLLTLVACVLGGATLLAVLLAPQLMRLYGHPCSPQQAQLATDFARFFLPQIVFYGFGAMIGAILNTRGRFAAPMWAPVANNLIVIATVLAFLAQPAPHGDSLRLTTAQLLTLGIGTTAGIVTQTVALLPSLRGTGFRLRIHFGLPLAELRAAASLAGWVFLYVLANQAGLLVVINLAGAAGRQACSGTGAGYSPYLYAFTVFSLPHAIVGVSIISALLPRMSRAALDGRPDRLRGDLSAGLRLAGVLVVPAAVGMLVLGPLIATVIFAHGETSIDDARLIGNVLGGFALGLVPFSAFQLHLRAFYAMGDTRTPALINVAVNVVNVAVDLLLYATLPPHWRLVGLAVGYSASYAAGLLLTTRRLARRLPGVRLEHVLRTYVRLAVAGLLGGAVGLAAALLVVGLLGGGPRGAAVALLAAIPLGAGAYLLLARRLRVAEVFQLRALLPGRRPGLRAG